ncbi:hypothetical protein BHE90_013893 [Fusarium euwallaceae]|uniref:Uncharacterized protein n=1 Tax=Fusarium euwallaceae TaxID=1147111 RepID=A0A430L7I0_9HYPO|nr:hypothetical protein BHE90_013893 [Fusarium euwallaceae]
MSVVPSNEVADLEVSLPLAKTQNSLLPDNQDAPGLAPLAPTPEEDRHVGNNPPTRTATPKRSLFLPPSPDAALDTVQEGHNGYVPRQLE